MSSEQLFSNGRIAVLSNKLLTSDKYARLADASSVSDALKLLAEYGYDTSGGDCEQALRRALEDMLDEVKELCTSKAALRFLLCKYDYHNAKVLMKGKYMRRDLSDSCFARATFPVDAMREAIENDDYSAFSRSMAEACDAIDTEFADGHRSAQIVDRLLDKAYFADLRHFAARSASRLLARLACAKIDAVNLALLPRMRRLGAATEELDKWLVEGGSVKRSTLVEMYESGELPAGLKADSDEAFAEASGKLLAEYADPFGLQPVVQYFYAKVAETEAIRRIFADIKSGVGKKE